MKMEFKEKCKNGFPVYVSAKPSFQIKYLYLKEKNEKNTENKWMNQKDVRVKNK